MGCTYNLEKVPVKKWQALYFHVMTPRTEWKALSHAIPPGELKAGDHIYVYRFFYQHHGIYVDDEEVIHFSGPKGSGSKSEAKISAVSLKEFLKGDPVRLVAYNDPPYYYYLKLSGTTHYEKSQPADGVISTAEMFLKYPELWPDYNVKHMNCENFAYYCKTNNMMLIGGQSVPIRVMDLAHSLSESENFQRAGANYDRRGGISRNYQLHSSNGQSVFK